MLKMNIHTLQHHIKKHSHHPFSRNGFVKNKTHLSPFVNQHAVFMKYNNNNNKRIASSLLPLPLPLPHQHISHRLTHQTMIRNLHSGCNCGK